jgi:hypothetical protein
MVTVWPDDRWYYRRMDRCQVLRPLLPRIGAFRCLLGLGSFPARRESLASHQLDEVTQLDHPVFHRVSGLKSIGHPARLTSMFLDTA